MSFSPLNFFFNFLNIVFTLFLLVFTIFSYRQWAIRSEYAAIYLTIALLITLILIFGRYLVMLAFMEYKDTDPAKLSHSPEGKYIFSYDGTKIYTEEYGEDKPQTIILTHGMGTNSRFWYHSIKYLSAKYRIIVWDLPGFGLSQKPQNGDFSTERYATDLRFILDKFALNKNTIIAGHSAGGMICLTFSRLYPEVIQSEIAGMILSNTTYTNPLHTSFLGKTLEKLQQSILVPCLNLSLKIPWLFKVFNWLNYLNGSMLIINYLVGFGEYTSFEKLDFVTRLGVMTDPYSSHSAVLEMLKFRVTEHIQDIKIPVKIFAGDQDKITEPEAGYFIKHYVPKSIIEVFENAGHILPIEKWEDFNLEVDSFCKDLPIQVSYTGELNY